MALHSIRAIDPGADMTKYSLVRAMLVFALFVPVLANAGVFRCQIDSKTVYQDAPCKGGGAVMEDKKWSPHSVEADIRKRTAEQQRQSEAAAKKAEKERFDRENAEEANRYLERRAEAYVIRKEASGLQIGMSKLALLEAEGWGAPDGETVQVRPDGKITVWRYDADDRGASWVTVTLVASRVVMFKVVK